MCQSWGDGDLPGGPVVSIQFFHAEGPRSIPDPGAKILQRPLSMTEVLSFRNNFKAFGTFAKLPSERW